MEIKVDVICDWTDGGIKKLKSIVEQKYSLDARMNEESEAILAEIANLISLPAPDVDEVAAEIEEIHIIDDE